MNIPAVFVLQIAYSLFMAMKTLIYIEKVRVPLLKDFGSFMCAFSSWSSSFTRFEGEYE